MASFKPTHSDHNEFVEPVEAPGGAASKKRPLDKKQGDSAADTSVAEPVAVVPFGKVTESEFIEGILAASDAEVLAMVEGISDEAIASLKESPMALFAGKRIAGAKAAKAKMPGCKKEDIDLLFAGQDLSEDFTSKAFTLFEGAVSGKVEAIRQEMEATYGASLTESTEEWKLFLEERLDTYLDMFVEEFFVKNEIAIAAGIKQEFSEQVMNSVSAIVESYGIELSDEKVDVAESLTKELLAKETELNESHETTATLRAEVKKFELKEAFASATVGMNSVDREKLGKLTENITFDTVEDYASKVNTLKEGMNATGNAAPVAANLDSQVNLTESTDVKLPAWKASILQAARGSL